MKHLFDMYSVHNLPASNLNAHVNLYDGMGYYLTGEVAWHREKPHARVDYAATGSSMDQPTCGPADFAALWNLQETIWLSIYLSLDL